MADRSTSFERGAPALRQTRLRYLVARTVLGGLWFVARGLPLLSDGTELATDVVVVALGGPPRACTRPGMSRCGRILSTTVASSGWNTGDGYAALIEARAPFPPTINATDGPAVLEPASTGVRQVMA